MYISFCINITDSHANVENVVKDARKPVITKVLILWDIIILFSKTLNTFLFSSIKVALFSFLDNASIDIIPLPENTSKRLALWHHSFHLYLFINILL